LEREPDVLKTAIRLFPSLTLVFEKEKKTIKTKPVIAAAISFLRRLATVFLALECIF